MEPEKKLIQILKTIILALLLVVGTNYVFAYIWSAPTSVPPDGNTASPINVTATGQSKAGGLSLNTIGTAPNGLIVWGSNSTTGKVGIGVTPTRKLDVNGDVRLRGHIYDSENSAGEENQFLARGEDGIEWRNAAGGQGGGSFWSQGSGTNIYNSNAGNVGVGSSNPTRKFDVNGDVRIRGHIYDSSGTTGSAGAAGQVLTRGQNGIEWKNATGGQGGTSFWAQGSGTSIYNSNNGKVGVGVSAPESTLHVKSNLGALSAIRVSPTADSIQASIAFTDSAGGLEYAIGKQEVVGNSADNTFFLWDHNIGKRFLQYFPTGVGNLTLNPTGGNVGIGTTGGNPPTATLDVNGNVRIRGGTPVPSGKFLSSSSDGTGSWKSVVPAPSSQLIPIPPFNPQINEQDVKCPAGTVMTGLFLHDWGTNQQSMRVKGIYCSTLTSQ